MRIQDLIEKLQELPPDVRLRFGSRTKVGDSYVVLAGEDECELKRVEDGSIQLIVLRALIFR